MTTFLIFLAFYAVFVLFDCHLYGKAKHPERTRSALYRMLPGGGFVAYLRFGRDKY